MILDADKHLSISKCVMKAIKPFYLAFDFIFVDPGEIILREFQSNCKQDVERVQDFGVKRLSETP